MSNILTPIVARYSVFFTLTMFSSSKISQTKQPTHVVQDLILAAEQRYKDRTTLKMRALIRNISTSTSSSSSSSKTRTSTSITTATSESEPPSSPSTARCMSSFPDSVTEAGSSSTPPTTASVTRPESTQCDLLTLSHVLTTPQTSSPPPTHAHSSLGPDIGQLSTHVEGDTFATITATSHRHEIDLPALSAVNGTFPENPVRKIRSASKVSKTSIATLLSVTLTMILLSLLQGKKRHARRQRRSLKRKPSRHHSKHHLAHSSSSALQQQHYNLQKDGKSCTSLTQSLQDEEMRTYTVNPECHADQEPVLLNSVFGPTHSSQSSPIDTSALDMLSSPYRGVNGPWSLSEGNLPGKKRSKQDFVDAWLEEQRHGMDEHMQDYPGRISPSWTGSEESFHVEEEEQRSLNPVYNIPDHHHCTHTPQHVDINRRAHDDYEPPRLNNEIYQGSLLPHPNHRHQHQHLNPQYHPRPPPHHHPHYHFNHLHPNYRPQKAPVLKTDQLGYYYQSQPQLQGRPDVFPRPQGNTTSTDGLRRSLSLTHAFPPRHSPPMLPVSISSIRFEHLTPAEKARHEYQMRRERQQIQHQQHRQQQIQQQYQGYPIPRHRAPLPNDAILTYSSRRSAHDLAWERHAFYQQQQHQEEIIAELKRKEATQPRHQLWQQGPGIQEQDLMARTSSLNRITSSSLSPKTAQELGLSRSKTVSAHGEQKRVSVVKRAESSATSKPSKGRTFVPADLNSLPQLPSPRPSTPMDTAKSILADCPVFSAGKRLMRKSDSKVNLDKKNDKHQSSTNKATPSSLTRKKTLKDLGPSLKSLARRYSTRLRPNSYAGSSSDPIIQFPEGKAIKSHSLTTRTSYISIPEPVTLSDGVVDLEQLQQSIQYLTPTERVPIHRRVTLYRPDITTPSTSPTDDSDDNQTSTNPSLARTRSLCVSLSKRDSLTLRLANGRGLDLTMFEPPKPTVATEEEVHRSTTALDGALPSIITSAPQTGATTLTKTSSPEDEQERTRRQVVAILAMGRKERVSAKTGQSIPRVSQGSTKVPLSPLALEAQEDPVPEVASVQPDPCEQISFMLVPKSRYEFQPLVAV
ncbi:hypothetical protein BGZ81_009744 [Podila clonocystis]|nr:hypothetical protein BGZ81_009744 [Podila clonocystis]